jgi:hypothetical protein
MINISRKTRPQAATATNGREATNERRKIANPSEGTLNEHCALVIAELKTIFNKLRTDFLTPELGTA